MGWQKLVSCRQNQLLVRTFTANKHERLFNSNNYISPNVVTARVNAFHTGNVALIAPKKVQNITLSALSAKKLITPFLSFSSRTEHLLHISTYVVYIVAQLEPGEGLAFFPKVNWAIH